MVSGKTIVAGITYVTCSVVGIYSCQKFKSSLADDMKLTAKAKKKLEKKKRFNILTGKKKKVQEEDKKSPHPIFGH